MITAAKKKAYAASLKRFAKAYDAMVNAFDDMEMIAERSSNEKLNNSWFRFRSDVTDELRNIMTGYRKHVDSFNKL